MRPSRPRNTMSGITHIFEYLPNDKSVKLLDVSCLARDIEGITLNEDDLMVVIVQCQISMSDKSYLIGELDRYPILGSFRWFANFLGTRTTLLRHFSCFQVSKSRSRATLPTKPHSTQVRIPRRSEFATWWSMLLYRTTLLKDI